MGIHRIRVRRIHPFYPDINTEVCHAVLEGGKPAWLAGFGEDPLHSSFFVAEHEVSGGKHDTSAAGMIVESRSLVSIAVDIDDLDVLGVKKPGGSARVRPLVDPGNCSESPETRR